MLNQSLQSQDQARIESAYDEVYDDLKDEGLAIWASTGSVPSALVPHVVSLVAFNCTETYSISPARYQRIVGKAGLAKREIRKVVTPEYVSQDDPTDY